MLIQNSAFPKPEGHNYLTLPTGESDITFDSRFDGGNLLRVEENITILSTYQHREFNIWVANDKPTDVITKAKATYGWFYFAVRNVKGCPLIKFNIVNLNMSQTLF